MAGQVSHLRLVDRGPPEPASGLGPAVGQPRPPSRARRRLAPGRPWDQLAAWWPPEHPAATGLVNHARASGIAPEIAFAVTLERSIAVGDLARAGIEMVPELDALASDARPAGPIGGSASLYLRQLSAGARERDGSRSAHGPFALPGRLVARLAHIEREALPGLLEGDLGCSLAWERAALLQARTICEWASLQALALSGAQAARPLAAPQPTGA